MRSKLIIVPFRRKHEGKTDYRKRLRMIAPKKIRLVVHSSLKNMMVQLVEYAPTGDHVIVGVHSQLLEKYGWTVHRGNLPAAYLTGYLLGRLAQKKKIDGAVLDIGVQHAVKGGRIYACVKGVIDAGVSIPVGGEEIFPSLERIRGDHIGSASQKSVKGMFQTYAKKNVDPTQMGKLFEQVKSMIGDKK